MSFLPWFSKVCCGEETRLVLDAREVPFAITPETVQLLCHQRQGIGADGLLLLMPSANADAGVRMYSSAGEEVFCNPFKFHEGGLTGIHALSYVLYRHGYLEKDEFTIDSVGDILPVALYFNDNSISATAIRCDQALLWDPSGDRATDHLGRSEVAAQPSAIDGLTHQPVLVNYGKIFAVMPVGNVAVAVDNWLAVIKSDRTMVRQSLAGDALVFCQIGTDQVVNIKVWDSAANEFLPSEWAVAATVVALRRLGSIDDRVRVDMDGYSFDAVCDVHGGVSLYASPHEICSGRLSEDLLHRL